MSDFSKYLTWSDRESGWLWHVFLSKYSRNCRSQPIPLGGWLGLWVTIQRGQFCYKLGLVAAKKYGGLQEVWVRGFGVRLNRYRLKVIPVWTAWSCKFSFTKFIFFPSFWHSRCLWIRRIACSSGRQLYSYRTIHIDPFLEVGADSVIGLSCFFFFFFFWLVIIRKFRNGRRMTG